MAIFNDDRNAVKLHAVGGSGVYDFRSNSTQLATLQQESGDSSSVAIIPRKAGTMEVLLSFDGH